MFIPRVLHLIKIERLPESGYGSCNLMRLSQKMAAPELPQPAME
jgi:hypothetical protein